MAHPLSLQSLRPAALATVGASLLGGCGVPPLLTVPQYLAQCDALRGKQVRVAGYVPECAGYECSLFADKIALNAFDDAWKRSALLNRQATLGAKVEDAKRDEAWQRVQALWPVGIGGARAFDLKAARFVPGYVVISGRVDKDNCTGAGGTDRSPGIEPTDIRTWRPDEGAPTNTQ